MRGGVVVVLMLCWLALVDDAVEACTAGRAVDVMIRAVAAGDPIDADFPADAEYKRRRDPHFILRADNRCLVNTLSVRTVDFFVDFDQELVTSKQSSKIQLDHQHDVGRLIRCRRRVRREKILTGADCRTVLRENDSGHLVPHSVTSDRERVGSIRTDLSARVDNIAGFG